MQGGGMNNEFKLSEVKDRIDWSKWTSERLRKLGTVRGFRYYGNTLAEAYSLDKEATLKAIEKTWGKAARTYVTPFLKNYDIPGNDAKTVASHFIVADKLIWDMAWEILEESPKRVRMRISGWCPLWETPMEVPGSPEMCMAAFEYERQACAVVNPKLKVSVPLLMSRGDSYCEMIFELED